MTLPALLETLEVLNNADLNLPFEFFTNGVPDDFTFDSIRAALESKDGHRLDLSTTDGTILKTAPGSFQFNVDKLVMWEMPAGIYNFDIIKSSLAGADNPLLVGKIKIRQGATLV